MAKLFLLSVCGFPFQKNIYPLATSCYESSSENLVLVNAVNTTMVNFDYYDCCSSFRPWHLVSIHQRADILGSNDKFSFIYFSWCPTFDDLISQARWGGNPKKDFPVTLDAVGPLYGPRYWDEWLLFQSAGFCPCAGFWLQLSVVISARCFDTSPSSRASTN